MKTEPMAREEFSRAALLLGDTAIEKLSHARVALFGLGGVGGYALEALARAGVGELHLIDNDSFSLSNLNRQILATQKTVGRPKVEVAKERVLDINPQALVHTYPMFYTPDTKDQLDFSGFDYVIDAIDTVSGKLALIQQACEASVPVISCMGTGNKLDPTAFQVTDLSKTTMCPLARVMRRELGKRGIKHMKVVYSQEEPLTPVGWEEEAAALGKRQIPGSVSFVPGAAGLILAGEVIKDLIR